MCRVLPFYFLWAVLPGISDASQTRQSQKKSRACYDCNPFCKSFFAQKEIFQDQMENNSSLTGICLQMNCYSFSQDYALEKNNYCNI